ncbi:hypothetical protein H4R19_003101 [Coemansia spiralis]|nr:hypothetical protein H4R19_003101 [Coemansia spiralis]
MDLPHTALVGLAVLREALGKRQPRIHYDVLGTLVRAGDLDGAITIASAVRSRLMFHLLASQWAARHPGHAQGVDSIVRSALAVLDCKFLRSTHHTAVTSILGATTGPQPGTATPKKELVRRALCLHRELAPRLETLSAPAINRLMQAAFDHNMASAALWVYHDAERRQALCAPRRRFSDDAIIATLAGFFTRQPNLRSFVRFIDVPSRSGLSRRHNLFTAMICELARSPGSKHSVDACGESQNRRPRAGSRVRRFQNAEAVLMLMRKNNIRPPAKAYHAVMHAWATLGQPRKVQWLANLLLADPRGDRQTRIGEVTWDILMYAYMRTHRACRVLGPLKRVRRWLRRHVGRAPAPETAGGHEPITSDLIDMAMSAYIEQGNGAHGKLPVSPGNRRTLGPTTCILAENRRFKQASRVPDDLHAQHTVPEPLVELKALLSHHMRMGDTASVLNVVRRILYHDYKLGCDYWGPVLYQCATLTDTSKLIVFLYEQWCQGLGIDGIAQVPPALVQDANLAYIVRGALRDQNRASDARAMATSPKAAKTPQHPRACTGAASKGASELCAPGRRRKLRLYRALLREIRQMPIPELRGKHMHNVRFVYDLYRDLDAHCPRVGELVREGAAHLKWLRSWHHHTDTCAALARRPEQDS